MQDQSLKMVARIKLLKTLVQEPMVLSGLSALPVERSGLMLLASALDETCGIKPSTDSIRRLLKDLQQPGAGFTEKGFKQNKLKEILAAYWLIRKGYLSKAQLQVTKSVRSGKHDKLEHIYFEQYVLSSKEKPKEKTPVQSVDFLGDIHALPDFFKNTYWYCYNYIQETGVINRNVVYISDQSDGVFLTCKLFNANPGYEGYNGVVCLDFSRCFLLFYMATEDTRSKHLHIKFRTPQGVRPSLLIGQDNIIGSQTNSVNSETLILEYVEDQDGNVPEQVKCFAPLTGGVYGAAMPKTIAAYLVFMKDRQLTSPAENLHNLEDLAVWLRKNYPAKADETLSSYCQKYWVYYAYMDEKDVYKIDELELELVQETQGHQFSARLKISAREYYEKALVLRNNNFITAYFFHEKTDTQRSSSIYLQIQVGGEFIEQDMECFVATISGLSDKQECAVSYLALVIPQSIPEFQRKDDTRISGFFNDSLKGGIETFPPRGFKLGNLNRMRGMGAV